MRRMESGYPSVLYERQYPTFNMYSYSTGCNIYTWNYHYPSSNKRTGSNRVSNR